MFKIDNYEGHLEMNQRKLKSHSDNMAMNQTQLCSHIFLTKYLLW